MAAAPLLVGGARCRAGPGSATNQRAPGTGASGAPQRQRGRLLLTWLCAAKSNVEAETHSPENKHCGRRILMFSLQARTPKHCARILDTRQKPTSVHMQKSPASAPRAARRAGGRGGGRSRRGWRPPRQLSGSGLGTAARTAAPPSGGPGRRTMPARPPGGSPPRKPRTQRAGGRRGDCRAPARGPRSQQRAARHTRKHAPAAPRALSGAGPCTAARTAAPPSGGPG